MSGSAAGDRAPPLRIDVEPWPAGGWAVWLEGHEVPVSRHDTQEEAQFRARAYRRALAQGRQLAFSPGNRPPPHPGGA